MMDKITLHNLQVLENAVNEFVCHWDNCETCLVNDACDAMYLQIGKLRKMLRDEADKTI